MANPVVKFRVDFKARCSVGPGKIALLEGIYRTGSLSQAARDLTMSYRRAWLLLSSLNAAFCEPVVVTVTGGRGGGGARLTAFGRRLVRMYREFDAEVQVHAIRRFRPIVSLARSKAREAARARKGVPVLRLKDR
ncbi:MAG TPA: LysR family transcriptional regulator [Steroidobacteraceae bacterium]|nr:LysR family transcriptional regulator [Steroidobacteraceae bacterium]